MQKVRTSLKIDLDLSLVILTGRLPLQRSILSPLDGLEKDTS
jgi:hypothetical protein